MSPTERSIAGIAGIVAAAIGMLWAADLVLARAEHAEVSQEARGYWTSGKQLLAEGRAAEALEPLRRAYAMQRANAQYGEQYGIDLVTALAAAGKFDEGAEVADELLAAKPNDGSANLAAARLMAHRGAVEDAKAYFHRAIYGLWPKDAVQRQIDTRMELAELLASRGDATNLLAELLPLEEDAERDPALGKRIAVLYEHAHSPARSANLYRILIHSGSADASLYQGLGNAELELGNYSASENAFLGAIRADGMNQEIRAGLQLVTAMARLDPTLRRLTSYQKYQRSVQLLQATRDSLGQCAPAPTALLEEADNVLRKRLPAHVTNEDAEERLTLAERLWAARMASCGSAVSPEEAPVARVIAKLTSN